MADRSMIDNATIRYRTHGYRGHVLATYICYERVKPQARALVTLNYEKKHRRCGNISNLRDHLLQDTFTRHACVFVYVYLLFDTTLT